MLSVAYDSFLKAIGYGVPGDAKGKQDLAEEKSRIAPLGVGP
jgi:hypothetical protein